jgi:hypothetical protein
MGAVNLMKIGTGMLVQPEATGSIIGALNRHDLIERLTIQAIRAPV